MIITFENSMDEPHRYQIFRALDDGTKEPLEIREPDKFIIFGDALAIYLDRKDAPPDQPIWGTPRFWKIVHIKSGRLIASRLTQEEAALCDLSLWSLIDWADLEIDTMLDSNSNLSRLVAGVITDIVSK